MAELRHTSALPESSDGRSAAMEAGGTVLREIRGRACVRLRSHLDHEPAVLGALPGLLPVEPLSTTAGEIDGLWLSPGQWLLTSDTRDAGQILAQVTGALESHLHSATDQSSALTVLSLEGPGARRLLTAGCALDFTAEAFPAGQVKRTRFTQLPLLIHRTAEAAYELYVDRSYALWLWQWLEAELTAPGG